MNDATLNAFRKIADAMIGKADWQWIGPHMSQRMFGISRERAENYAQRHGGEYLLLARQGRSSEVRAVAERLERGQYEYQPTTMPRR